MEHFKIESRYLELCNKFRAIIRCMKDYQKGLSDQVIKTLNVSIDQKAPPTIVSKHAAEPLKHSAELLRV